MENQIKKIETTVKYVYYIFINKYRNYSGSASKLQHHQIVTVQMYFS